MLNRLSRIIALVAALGYASVAYGQAKTTYSGEGTFTQIGQISAWAPDQCVNESPVTASACMKEALQLIHDMHGVIVRMGRYNLAPSVAERSAINASINKLANRIDKWGEQYKIQPVRVSASSTK